MARSITVPSVVAARYVRERRAMFARFRAFDSSNGRDADRPATHRVGCEPGRYLTDGVRLYRVVAALASPSGRAMVELEDCRSLEVVLMPADQLDPLALRAVRPASGT
jgi:hypothetical protein